VSGSVPAVTRGDAVASASRAFVPISSRRRRSPTRTRVDAPARRRTPPVHDVTNVREDGRLPMPPVDPWTLLNTYRTNAQVEDGRVCVPIAGG
jgi:hypothetical protein